MAIGDAYATVAQYKAQTGKSGAGDDVPLARSLLAVTHLINKKLRRPAGFNKDAAAVARVFRPRHDDSVLDVPDLVSVAAIGIDAGSTGLFDTVLKVADYELLPFNADDGPESRPYDQIGLLSWRSRTRWIAGQRVEVTAVWGWPAVPDAIVDACIELTAILRVESPRATNTVNELDQVLSTSRVAQNILSELMAPYGRLPGFAA